MKPVSAIGLALAVATLAGLGWASVKLASLRDSVDELGERVAAMEAGVKPAGGGPAGGGDAARLNDEALKIRAMLEDVKERQAQLGGSGNGGDELTFADLRKAVEQVIADKEAANVKEQVEKDMQKVRRHDEGLHKIIVGAMKMDDAQAKHVEDILAGLEDDYRKLLLNRRGDFEERVMALNAAAADRIKALLNEEQAKYWDPSKLKWAIGNPLPPR
jgi:hypothetical protein